MSDTAEPAPPLAANSTPARPTQVRMSGVGIHIPDGLKYDEWAKAGRQLSGIVDSSAWWLGDWLVFGKAHFPDRYQVAIQSAGLSYQTLRNYSWVTRRFPPDRRRPNLTFRHHAEVASLPLEDQERLLDQAEQDQWTTKRLRTAIQQDRRGDSTDAEGTVAPVQQLNSRIAVPTSRVGKWREAAVTAGVDFDQWVLDILDRAASETLVHSHVAREENTA